MDCRSIRRERIDLPSPLSNPEIDGKNIMLLMKREHDGEEKETRDHMLVERIQRLVKEMSEGHDHEHGSQCEECFSSAPSNEQ